MMKAVGLVQFVLPMTLLFVQAGHADSGVERIMQLRIEIEAKNNEWELKNKAFQSTTDGLLQRITELEAQNAKNKAGLGLIRARLEAGETRLLRRQTLSAGDRNRLLATLAKAETQFKTRLPFLSARSVEETERLRAILLNKQSSTDEVALELAAFLKSELKSARGLRLERAQIPLDGRHYEAEIVRLGEYSAIAAVPESSGVIGYRQIEAGNSEWRRLAAIDDIRSAERVFRVAREKVSVGSPAVIIWPLNLVDAAGRK